MPCTRTGIPLRSIPAGDGHVRKNMRYFWITIGVAVIHRLATAGIALLGFGIGMTAFNSSPYAKLGLPIMGIAAIMDFPVVVAGQINYMIENGHFPKMEHWGMYGVVSLKSPFVWQAAWSLLVGVIASYFYYRYRLKKYGPQPTVYWK